MVTTVLSHCLINMIVLKIMLSVIYLCNIAGSVIVHVDSYPACGMKLFQNFLCSIHKKGDDRFYILNVFLKA